MQPQLGSVYCLEGSSIAICTPASRRRPSIQAAAHQVRGPYLLAAAHRSNNDLGARTRRPHS